jgi:hypothetical protein
MTTLEQSNAALREAVAERLAATPADDPKMKGYKPPPLAGCKPAEEAAAAVLADAWQGSCCEGQRLRGDSLLAETRHPSSQAFVQLLGEMQRLHESKSADYGSEDDPLANIRNGAEFVSIEAWRGCMVRIADKVQRLRTFCRTGRLVHEGVRDTLLDLAAYSLLAIVLFDEGKDA